MMQLAEILVFTDIRRLHQIADHYGCQCNPHSKNELITTLLSNLRHKQTVRSELERLASHEQHFLLLLFLDKRDQLLLEDVLAKAGMALDCAAGKSGDGARRLVADALKRGWLFPANGMSGGQFQIPGDIRELYLQSFREQVRSQTNRQQTPQAYRDEGTAICDDMLQFLQFLLNEPVPLTSEGGMYKRYQSQLFHTFAVKESLVANEKWRFGYGLHFNQYPDRFSLIYDFCFYRQWIQEQSGRVEITEKGAEFLAGSYTDETYHELIRFWLRLYKRAIPNLPMLVQFIPMISGDEWVSLSDLQRLLLPWIKPFYYDDPDQILANRILKMMVHLGLLKAGHFEELPVYSGTYACQSWLREYNGFAETAILLK